MISFQFKIIWLWILKYVHLMFEVEERDWKEGKHLIG